MIALRERFHDTVDLLRLTRKADVHEQPPYGDIQRILSELEPMYVGTQGARMKVVSA